MAVEIIWHRRDPELGRVQLRVSFKGDQLEWRLKGKRFEPWQPYVATSEDWDDMLEHADKLAQRGQIDAKHMLLLKKSRAAAAAEDGAK